MITCRILQDSTNLKFKKNGQQRTSSLSILIVFDLLVKLVEVHRRRYSAAEPLEHLTASDYFDFSTSFRTQAVPNPVFPVLATVPFVIVVSAAYGRWV